MAISENDKKMIDDYAEYARQQHEEDTENELKFLKELQKSLKANEKDE